MALQTEHGNACPWNWLVRASLLVGSLLVTFLAIGTAIAAACQGKWWPIVFLPVMFVAATILVVVLLVFAFLGVAVHKVFPWARAASRQAGSLKHIPFDESVRVSRIHWLVDTLPPSLYIDDYTVMSEVSDLRELQEGDHCIVGVNILHNLSPRVDAIVSRLTSLELLPLRVYHHFILVDSVDRLTAEGLPLRTDGRPVCIAEYSETFPGGLRRITARGYNPMNLWRGVQALLASPARYQTPPLSTYLPPQRRKGYRGNGIFRVHQALSEEQRRSTRQAALALASSSTGEDVPSYGIFSANCEHVCFSVCAQSQRWISPQVSHMFWCIFRLLLQVCSLFWLVGLGWLGHFTDEPHLHAVLAALYQLLSTVPVLLQTQVHLVRTAVNLTQRRLELGQVVYNYLIIKETVRALVVGGIAVTTLALMPRLVWDTNCVGLASVISLTIYPVSSVLFNLSLQVLVRASQRAGVGVPVVLFDDLRSPSMDSICETDLPGTDSPRSEKCFRSDTDAEDLCAENAKAFQESSKHLVDRSTKLRKHAIDDDDDGRD